MNDTVTIRISTDGDRAAIRELAQLDGKRDERGPMLLAEIASELRAAVPVEPGPALADPFHPTADLVSLLTLRVTQMRAAANGRARSRAGRVRVWRRPRRTIAVPASQAHS